MHSSAAYNMIEQHGIGFLHPWSSRALTAELNAQADPHFLDFEKSLIHQMAMKRFDKKHYLEQVSS